MCRFLTDIDECLLGRDDCHPNAECINLPGTFLCVCSTGYDGDGLNCIGETRTAILTLLLISVHTVSHALHLNTQTLMSVLRVWTLAARWLNVPTLWGAMSVNVSMAIRETGDSALVHTFTVHLAQLHCSFSSAFKILMSVLLIEMTVH